MTRIRLWDWPVRLCHWSFVLLVPAMWWTAENDAIDIHVWLGVALFAVVLLRLIWGVVGSETARFSRFVKGPGAIAAYLRGAAPAALGHNPLGAISVVALLGALSVQLAMGLVAQDEYGLVAGPLNRLVSYDTAEAITELHEDFFNVIVALIALHLAAIAFYQFVRRTGLVGPMLTGNKAVPAGVAAPKGASAAATWGAVAVTAAITAWVALGAPPFG